VTTVWDNQISRNHAELVGLTDTDMSMQKMLESSGMAIDAVRGTIDSLITSQSVMLATNQLMMGIAVAFLVAASVIWLAPKPSRVVEPGAGGH
jgi:DHA2 family multidrug resistance protein